MKISLTTFSISHTRGFASIDLVEDRDTKKLFALKRITCHCTNDETAVLKEVAVNFFLIIYLSNYSFEFSLNNDIFSIIVSFSLTFFKSHNFFLLIL